MLSETCKMTALEVKKVQKNMREFYDSSPEAAQKATTDVRHNAKYPWDTLPVGKSFFVNKNEIKITTLRPYANRMGKKLNKRFNVVVHENGYEVARVPFEDGQEQKPTNIVEALRQQEGKSE